MIWDWCLPCHNITTICGYNHHWVFTSFFYNWQPNACLAVGSHQLQASLKWVLWCFSERQKFISYDIDHYLSLKMSQENNVNHLCVGQNGTMIMPSVLSWINFCNTTWTMLNVGNAYITSELQSILSYQYRRYLGLVAMHSNIGFWNSILLQRDQLKAFWKRHVSLRQYPVSDSTQFEHLML